MAACLLQETSKKFFSHEYHDLCEDVEDPYLGVLKLVIHT